MVVGLILTFLNTLILFTIIGKGIYDSIAGKSKKGQIVLANLDPEVANDITQQFTYKAPIKGEQEYYSPTLNSLIKYDSENYFVSENNDSVSILRDGIYDLDVSTRVKISDTPLTKESQQKNLEILYTDVKLEGESEIEGLKALEYSYVRESFINDTKSVFVSIYIQREVEGKTIYAAITYPNVKEVGALASDIAKILNNIIYSPESVPQDIKTVLNGIGVEFEYNKDKWSPSSITESSAFISYLSEKNESIEKNKYSTSTISIFGSKQYSETTLEDHHKVHASYDYLIETYDTFKVVEDSSKRTFKGLEALYTEYTYDFFGDLSRKRVYTFFTENKSHIISVQLFTSNDGTDGENEIEKVVKSITFKPVETESDELSQTYTTQTGNVLGSSSVTIDKSTIIGKPAVAKIYNRNCVNIRIDSKTGLETTPTRTYDICSGGVGTGFYVSSDGYLISNGHVATPNALDSVVTSLNSLNPPQFWSDFANDIAKVLLQQTGVNIASLSPIDLVYLVLGVFVELNQEGSITLTSTYENYIVNGEKFDIDMSTYLPNSQSEFIKLTTVTGQVDSSVLAGYNSAKNIEDGLKTPDLAILKIEDVSGVELPSLRLTEEQFITSGMAIHVLGFPAAVDVSSHLSSIASNIPTITTGTISAIKPSQSGTFNLVQIDASVSGGNSGGPILNSQGEVVAVTTYALTSGSADYNFGVSVKEVSDYLTDNGITPKEGEVTKRLISGAQNLEKQYYKYAVADFKKVIELYPNAKSSINPLIAVSQKKIDEGEDRTPLFNTLLFEEALSKMGVNVNGNILTIAIITFVGLILSLIFISILLILRRRNLKSKTPPIVGNSEMPEYTKQIQDHSTIQANEEIESKPMQSEPSMQIPQNRVDQVQSTTPAESVQQAIQTNIPVQATVPQQPPVVNTPVVPIVESTEAPLSNTVSNSNSSVENKDNVQGLTPQSTESIPTPTQTPPIA